MPLYDLKITNKDVEENCREKDFRLGIHDEVWNGNCVDCYLKTDIKRIKAAQDHPEIFYRRSLIEKAAGDVMRRGSPSGEILEKAKRMNVTREQIENDNGLEFSCVCN